MIIPQSFPLYVAVINPGPKLSEVGSATCQAAPDTSDVWFGLVLAWDVTNPRETVPLPIAHDLSEGSSNGGTVWGQFTVFETVADARRARGDAESQIGLYWTKHEKCDEAGKCLA